MPNLIKYNEYGLSLCWPFEITSSNNQYVVEKDGVSTTYTLPEGIYYNVHTGILDAVDGLPTAYSLPEEMDALDPLTREIYHADGAVKTNTIAPNDNSTYVLKQSHTDWTLNHRLIGYSNGADITLSVGDNPADWTSYGRWDYQHLDMISDVRLTYDSGGTLTHQGKDRLISHQKDQWNLNLQIRMVPAALVREDTVWDQDKANLAGVARYEPNAALYYLWEEIPFTTLEYPVIMSCNQTGFQSYEYLSLPELSGSVWDWLEDSDNAAGEYYDVSIGFIRRSSRR